MIVHNKVGRVSFYAKVFESGSFANQVVDKNNYDFASQAFLYAFNDPKISVSS